MKLSTIKKDELWWQSNQMLNYFCFNKTTYKKVDTVECDVTRAGSDNTMHKMARTGLQLDAAAYNEDGRTRNEESNAHFDLEPCFVSVVWWQQVTVNPGIVRTM